MRQRPKLVLGLQLDDDGDARRYDSFEDAGLELRSRSRNALASRDCGLEDRLGYRELLRFVNCYREASIVLRIRAFDCDRSARER